MSLRSDDASIKATKSTSVRLDAVLRAGQVEAARRDTDTASPVEAVRSMLRRAQVSDSRTALEHCQQNAKDLLEQSQRLSLKLQAAEKREETTREECEYKMRELELTRNSLRLQLQELQEKLANKSSLTNAEIGEIKRKLSQAEAGIAERDSEIEDYSVHVAEVNRAQMLLRAEIDGLRSELDNVKPGVPVNSGSDNGDEEPEWLQVLPNIINAADALQEKIDALEKENSVLQSKLDAEKKDNVVDHNLIASLETQVRKMIEELMIKVPDKDSGIEREDILAMMCTLSRGDQVAFNVQLSKAIAAGNVRDALRLIRQGAKLLNGSFQYNNDVYRGRAGPVLFCGLEDGYTRTTGNSTDISITGGSSSPFYQCKEDTRSLSGMLQIIDQLADNHCTGTSFELNFEVMGYNFPGQGRRVTLSDDPISWNLLLVKHAYEKNIMPPETKWSLLNSAICFAFNSPLLRAIKSVGDAWDRDENNSKKKYLPEDGLQALKDGKLGEWLLENEKKHIQRTRDLIKTAKDLGQMRINGSAYPQLGAEWFKNSTDLGAFPDPEYNWPFHESLIQSVPGVAERNSYGGTVRYDARSMAELTQKYGPHPLKDKGPTVLALLKERYALLREINKKYF